jgi:pimeloyl-ACP methyl ester carboxylesterase
MRLTHGRIQLELHTLRAGLRSDDHADARAKEERPLLLLHELGGASSQWSVEALSAWPGPIHALDFPGHGASDRLIGGGYTPEYYLADADIAVHAIDPRGRCALAGAGIGGYVAMLLAATRRESIPGALILPGRGLAGGGLLPDWSRPPFPGLDEWDADNLARAKRYLPETDPMVAECERDIRPESYVRAFADEARGLILSEAVSTGDEVPTWWPLATAAPQARIVSHDLGKLISALREVCNEEDSG